MHNSYNNQTTLIVTPNSLAQQWADELKLHAPSLKVLVYDGHTKVKVPITESDLALFLAERAKAAKKAKARADRVALTAAKLQKTSESSKSTTSPSKGKRKADALDVDEEGGAEDAETQNEPLDWCNYVNTFDVCITTYNVLQQDLGIARPPPDRPRRTVATYFNLERSRSPLVMCEWYRVIMDEVQMVGGGKTE
jgi:E3 ubiquitin-protein ligase SHPRH